MKKYIQAIGFIILCQAAGIIGSVFTMEAIPNWYQTIEKPMFNPPNWIFGPVWTLLFTLMGIAMYLVFKKAWPKREAKLALGFFTVHLVVNTMWSVIFFNWHELGLALAVIILMWLMIATSIYLFKKIQPLAGWLLVPYILWVSFATILNASIWLLNR